MKENKLIMGVDPEVLAVWRDIVYVVCTLIQTFCGAWFFNYFRDKRKRKKDRKRKDKQREEDRQKADADNLAAVLGQTFDEVERIFDRFDKKVVKLGEKKITDRFSEHDVLVHMCHPDNQETFAKPNGMDTRMSYAASNQETLATPNQFSRNTGHRMEMDMLDVAGNQGMLDTTNQSKDTSTYGIKQVMSDVDSIMKLFIEFRLKLSIIHNKTCPKDIKDEFSSEIKKMGEAIYPFVSEPRQKVIKLALEYFDQEEDQQERGTQTQTHSTGSECQEVYCLRCLHPMHSGSSTPRASDEGNTVDTPLDTIVDKIPYIKFLQYKDGNMDFNNTMCADSNLLNLERHVRGKEEVIMAKKDEIQSKILTALDGQQVPAQQTASDQEYLLHLIRSVMLKIQENKLDHNKLNDFSEYVKQIDSLLVRAKTKTEQSKRSYEK